MATCDVTGKHYVGITHRSLARRRGEHIHAGISANKPHPFARAIRKHGPGAFKWKIVQTFMFPEDAAAAEEALIKELGRHNTYNFTKGGFGKTGCVMPEKARKAISARHKGNRYNVGKKSSDETRQKLREIGLKKCSLRRFSKYRWLGPAASSRPVVCLDTGETFESASSAARKYGFAKSLIIEVCNRDKRRRCAGDLVFRYLGDHLGGLAEANAERQARQENRSKHANSTRKAVRCVDDGIVYSSAKEAQEAYSIHRSFIGEVCRGEKASARGLRFEYLGGGHVA